MAPGELDPVGFHPGSNEDDRHLGVELSEPLDEPPRAVGLARGPGVVDEDVGALGDGARTTGEDRAAPADGTETPLHLVARPPEGVGLLIAEVDVVMDDEDVGHGSTSTAPGGRWSGRDLRSEFRARRRPEQGPRVTAIAAPRPEGGGEAHRPGRALAPGRYAPDDAPLPRTSVGLRWDRVLAWRIRRHYLVGRPASSLGDVVDRLCGVQAQVPSSAELAVRVRLERSEPGLVERALAAGEVVRTWAMRGTLHLLTPATGPALLAVMAAGRSWERPSWERFFGASPAAIERLREVAHEALARGPLTRGELAAAVATVPELRHPGEGLASN